MIMFRIIPMERARKRELYLDKPSNQSNGC